LKSLGFLACRRVNQALKAFKVTVRCPFGVEQAIKTASEAPVL